MIVADVSVTIKYFEEFITEILNFNDALPHKFISYRGQSDVNYNIIPAIGRNRASSVSISILDQERNLVEMAKNKLPSIFNKELTPINLLALLQHYGIPTRLLDITSNPLVSLYFATLDDTTDGEVIVFEHEDSVINYPAINAIAESYKFAHMTNTPLEYFFGSAIHQKYFDEQRYELKEETDLSGGRWIASCCNELIMVSAQEQIERQRRQQGLYILFPNKIIREENPYFENIIEEIPKTHKQIKKRILIPQDLKQGIRNKLKILGISKSTLFYDNIDTICQEIVEQATSNLSY